MVGGLVVSTLVFAAGAIMDFAVTVSTTQHGFNIHTVGVILMIVGAVGFIGSIATGALREGGWRHSHRTIVDDGQGHVARREDTYT